MIAGCSRYSEKYADPRLRDATLLKEGLIYYGEDPQDDDFDDMYYAFAAGEAEMVAASALALDGFSTKVDQLSRRDRRYLYDVFTDLADLAEMANYAYKDAPVAIPEGWEDIGVHDPKVMEIFDMNLVSGFVAGGLKCSLMAKGERKVLVFAGTDFPASWKSYEQVLGFIADAYEDVYGALNKDASQVKLASEIVDELLAAGIVTKDKLEFAGHSLGGRLASEMSVRYGCPAVVFNAAGVSPEIYQIYEDARAAAGEQWRGYVLDVVSANDPLTCAQKYMSGQTDPFSTRFAKVMSSDKNTVDELVSLGLDLLGSIVNNVMGDTKVVSKVKQIRNEYGEVVEECIEEYYERDYRAIGAVMPVRENMAGHGIGDLAVALRERAQICD